MTRAQTIIISVLTAILIAGVALWFLLPDPAEAPEAAVDTDVVVPQDNEYPIETNVIGTSVEGREISAVTFGDGEQHVLFVGGIHGGYEWNSSLLAHQYIAYLRQNPTRIPENVSVTIIPTLNPDGLATVVATSGTFSLADIADPDTRVAEGRFNANGVDLNRNFGCKWAPESTWRGEVVSAGTEAFSEPEAAALRDFVLANQPDAVIFWHSKANNVYASECEDGILPGTLTLMEIYAEAAGYGQVPAFDAYPITGDAEGWLASIGIPAVTVELKTHNSSEAQQNFNASNAVLQLYASPE